jgi:hypothetical protein
MQTAFARRLIGRYCVVPRHGHDLLAAPGRSCAGAGGVTDAPRVLDDQALKPDGHVRHVPERELLDRSELVLQVLKVVIIEGKLALERAVRDVLVLLEPAENLG